MAAGLHATGGIGPVPAGRGRRHRAAAPGDGSSRATSLTRFPGVLGSIPRQQRIVVVDAYMAVFLPEERRAQLAGILAQAGAVR